MSEGSGNAEADGKPSKLELGHVEIVWEDYRPEGLLGCKGDDDGGISDAASAGTNG
jgi:hypothetical protein